jgi:hypothetical protein
LIVPVYRHGFQVNDAVGVNTKSTLVIE